MEISCGFLIQNTDGKILITHPTNDFCGYGIWTLPKGLIEENETFLECALREVYEETNLKLTDLQGEISYLGNSIRNNREVVLFHFKASEDLSLKKIRCNSIVEGEDFYENDEFKWVSILECYGYLSLREQNMISKRFKLTP